MRLTLAVPDLLAQSRETLAAVPSLARLAHFAGAPTTQRGRLDSFLVSESATSGAPGIAPLAAFGAGLDPANRYVLRADPVSLVAGRSDVVLAARIDDLDASDADALISSFNAHFGRDGLAFRAPRPDAWFVMVDHAPDLATTPLSAVHGAIYPWLPSGNDAGRWRRWMSEMQMLLHEHPANTAREARGRVPVTGIWIADGGRLADIAQAPTTAIFATPGPAGDVARGLAQLRGNAAREPPADFVALAMHDSATVILGHADAANISAFDRNWFGPAVAALERGTLTSLQLFADGKGVTAAWRAQRPAWNRRVLANFATRPFALHPFASRPFAPPLPDEDDA